MILGTGVDIIEVRRLKKAVERWGRTFLNKVFTKAEQENAEKRGNRFIHLAGRFAAKEAVFKALGDPGLTFTEVEVLNDASGKPVCKLLNSRNKKVRVHLSISHVKTYAVASAVVTQES